MPDLDTKVTAYDKTTGQQVTVPERFLTLYPHLSKTKPSPTQQAPARSASKGDWVAYATSQGMPEAEADAMTRDQLAEHFTKEG